LTFSYSSMFILPSSSANLCSKNWKCIVCRQQLTLATSLHTLKKPNKKRRKCKPRRDGWWRPTLSATCSFLTHRGVLQGCPTEPRFYC
jgi:hypothetical protein